MRLIASSGSCLGLMLASLTTAQAEDRFEHPPILYSQSTPNNPVSELQDKLKKNKLNWKPEKHTGHLRSLLKALKIDIDSQTLNFSKTSLQGRLISPGRPRASPAAPVGLPRLPRVVSCRRPFPPSLFFQGADGARPGALP